MLNRVLRRMSMAVLCSLAAWSAYAQDGCLSPKPTLAPTQIEVNGLVRPLITVVPQGYQPGVPHALVIAFHGRTNPAARARGYYDLERHAATPTLFVYPSGVPNGSGKFSWWSPRESGDNLRDYALFDAILARMKADYCVGAVYLVGHSLGASIANNLGCARGVFVRAIVTVAGGIQRPNCNGQIAAMIVHNPNDRLVPFAFGVAARKHFENYGPYSGLPISEQFIGLNCQRHAEATGAFPLLWCVSHFDLARKGRYYPHQWPPDMGARAMAFFDSLADEPDDYFSFGFD